MSNSWSIYVIVLTVISFVGLIWVLFANRTTPLDPDSTTGHEYDGIQEYDQPLPAWWFNAFVLSIVFAIAYLLAYPGLGNFPGLLKWTQVNQWQKEVQRAQERFEPVFAAYRKLPVEEVAKNPQALKMGQRIFANNCAQCHGADARGSRGFPNLSDNLWLWGGSVDAIHTTIHDGRQAAMPAWGAVLGEPGVDNVAQYVLTLSGTSPASPASASGEVQFKAICAACHGADGKGNQALGAPDLSDAAWLYGSELEEIKHTIRSGRGGHMPNFGGQLTEDKIHLLTAYVYSLSQPR